MAVKQGADCAREAGHEVGEEGDDPEALAMERWAEVMVRRGVDRRTALQCAAAIWEVQRAKDGACAGDAVLWAGPVPGVDGDKLVEVLSRAREARNSKLAIGCLFFAMGRRPYGLSSFRDLAKEQDVSPEAVSNEVEAMQEILGGQRTMQQKSAKAVDAYRGTNGARTKGKAA